MPLGLIPLLLLAIPLSEIAVFVLVGSQIGVLATIGLVLLTAASGAMLLRIQGFAIVSRLRSEIDAGRVPGRELASGVMILAAGLLLLTPGFITDTIGLLLFIPPLRERLWSFLSRRVLVRATAFSQRSASDRSGRPSGARTIDLDPEDFHSDHDPATPVNGGASPWRGPGRDRNS